MAKRIIRKKKKIKTPEKDENRIYVQVFEGGRKYETHSSVKMELRKPWQKPNPQEIRSVIPGSVLSFFVQEGEAVARDQEIMVYEAMKMHNVVRAPFGGVVEKITVQCGDRLQKGVLMMVIKPSEPTEVIGPDVQEFNLEDFG